MLTSRRLKLLMDASPKHPVPMDATAIFNLVLKMRLIEWGGCAYTREQDGYLLTMENRKLSTARRETLIRREGYVWGLMLPNYDSRFHVQSVLASREIEKIAGCDPFLFGDLDQFKNDMTLFRLFEDF